MFYFKTDVIVVTVTIGTSLVLKYVQFLSAQNSEFGAPDAFTYHEQCKSTVEKLSVQRVNYFTLFIGRFQPEKTE